MSGGALLERVVGQPTALGTIRRALAEDRLHHALLFEGPAGVGKSFVAEALAQALLCERRVGGLPCGVCASCTKVPRKDANGRSVHPDFAPVARGMYDPAAIGRKSQETQDISVDQVRTVVLARIALGPVLGVARLFLVREADELSVAAANALLKTLEEPPPRTYFVLTTTRPGELLPTIRSRTQRIRFAPLPEDALVQVLTAEGHEPARARAVAKDAQGSLAAARATLAGSENEAEKAWIAAFEGALGDKTFAGALRASESSKGSRESVAMGLEAFAAHLVEEARACVGEPSAKALRAAERYVRVQKAMRQLEGNGSPQLVVEALLADLRSVP
jgi:DNA polymerase III subunit delta'